MSKRIAITNLNASTIDILNVIRQYASEEYQSKIPAVETARDIPKVGEVLYGYPALANQFINALINRIAMVRVKSATFNNTFAPLKKGYLEFGETVEEVFVNIAKAREFSTEKAESREFKRSLPDVRTAFHAINWRVQYPITVQNEDLRQAFTNVDGVTDLISRVVQSVYTAAEYDEYLLFKYLIIKGVNNGQIKPISVGASSDFATLAAKFRGISNKLQFIKTDYNLAGVHTATPKDDQYIFMDADFNAEYDVNVLAAAFNMDKADFTGHLKLVDDWTSFDNERFSQITAGSDLIEEVTADELAVMSNVKSVLVDEEFFQVYDNTNIMTEQYVASGLYWNYFYNVWKTVSTSPFSNAVVFIAADETVPADSITATVTSIDQDADGSTVITLNTAKENVTYSQDYVLANNSGSEGTIAVEPYGAFMIDATYIATTLAIGAYADNTLYTATLTIADLTVGGTITLAKQA